MYHAVGQHAMGQLYCSAERSQERVRALLALLVTCSTPCCLTTVGPKLARACGILGEGALLRTSLVWLHLHLVLACTHRICSGKRN